jgi:NAD(P)-dependent dehydrogenase (short-subunit alcohol dehydrogenase family)
VRTEAAAHGIHLTLVCPGYITTNLPASGMYGGDLDAERARERIPFKFIDVPTAVRHILDAVLARRQLAVFPGYVRGL